MFQNRQKLSCISASRFGIATLAIRFTDIESHIECTYFMLLCVIPHGTLHPTTRFFTVNVLYNLLWVGNFLALCSTSKRRCQSKLSWQTNLHLLLYWQMLGWLSSQYSSCWCCAPWSNAWRNRTRCPLHRWWHVRSMDHTVCNFPSAYKSFLLDLILGWTFVN